MKTNFLKPPAALLLAAGLLGSAGITPALAESHEMAPRILTFDRAPGVEDLEQAFGLKPRAIIAAASGDRLDRPLAQPDAAKPNPVVAKPKKPKPAKARPIAVKPAVVKPVGAIQPAPPGHIKPGPVPDVWVADRVEFANSSDAVLSSQLGIVDTVGSLMLKRPEVVLIISGHANATGAHAFNDSLSRRRAEAVRDHLVRLYRVNPNRFVLRWMGAREPLPGFRPRAAGNRRVQFGIYRR